MNCYEPYELPERKEKYGKKFKYIMDKDCCDLNTCDMLSADLQLLKHECNDIFGQYHDINERGVIQGNYTTCDSVKNKEKEVLKKIDGYLATLQGISTMSSVNRGGIVRKTRKPRNKKNRTHKKRTNRRKNRYTKYLGKNKYIKVTK